MKRLNVKLLAILLVSFVVLSGGLYLLWKWQVGRNAAILRIRADNAEKSGDYENAIRSLTNYVLLKPADKEGWTQLALTAVRWTESPQADTRAFGKTLGILEQATQAHPDNDEVREELVKFYMQLAPINPPFYADAESHLAILIPKKSGQQKADLEVELAKCHLHSGRKQEAMELLAAIVGYDLSTGELDDTRAVAPATAEAYHLLARILEENKNPAADRVIDKLTSRNPRVFKAFLYRGQFLREFRKERLGEAKADLEQARRLLLAQPNPEKDDRFAVGLSLSRTARDLGQFDVAKAELEGLKKDYPDDERLYQELAELSIAQAGKANLEDALDLANQGLLKKPNSAYLLWLKCTLLISLDRTAEARQILPKLRETKQLQQPFIDFLDGQILFAEKRWLDAAAKVEQAMPVLPDLDLRVRAGMLLAQSYFNLSRWDQALQACDRVLSMNPKTVAAILMRAEILKSQGEGRRDDVVRQLEEAQQYLPENSQFLAVAVQSNKLQMALYKEMEKPEGQRDWKEVNAIVAEISPDLEESKRLVLQAEIAGIQGRDAEAARLLQEAQVKYPKESGTWIASAKVASRAHGPEAALAVLDQGEQASGDSAALRMARAVYLGRLGAERARAGLHALGRGLDRFTAEERKSIRTQLGAVYFSLGEYAAAGDAWRAVRAEFPQDPTMTLAIFDLERERGSEEGMKSALAEIEKSYGAQSSEAKLARATLLLFQIDKQIVDGSKLSEVRRLLEEVKSERSTWDRPYRFLADVDLLQGRINGAIENLKRVLQVNPADEKTAARLLVILAGVRNYKDAALLIPNLGQGPFRPPFYRLLSEVYEANGQPKEALEAAAKAVPEHDSKAEDYIWYGAMLARNERAAEAEAAYRKACELEPTNSRHWLSLVEHLALSQQNAKIAAAIRDAAKHIAKAHVTLATGQALNLLAKKRLEKAKELAAKPDQKAAAEKEEAEAQKSLEQAGQYFIKAAEEGPDDVLIQRALAAHFANSNQRDKIHGPLDRIIASADRITGPDLEHLRWARQIKAQFLASTGDYRDFLQALDLLKANSDMEGGPSPEDTRIRAMLLAARTDEPVHWTEALRYFERLKEMRGLYPPEQMVLAQLYHNAGKYDRAQAEAQGALAAEADNKRFVETYINMLLEEDEFDKAGPWIEKLRQMEPNSLRVAVAVARVHHERGQSDRAKQVIRQVVASLGRENQDAIIALAGECLRLKYHDVAEELYRDAAKDPKYSLYLGAFLAQVGNLEEAFAIFGRIMAAQQASPSPRTIDAVTLNALAGLYSNREKASRQHLDMLEQWLKQGVTAAPDAAAFQVRLAELYDMKGDVDEVVRRYRALLDRPDLDVQSRGRAMNNLAYMLATRHREANEAIELVNGSIEMLGPKADLLDTRAVVLLVLGKAQEAVKDAELANLGRVDRGMLFHLAWAHFDAENPTAARSALNRALDIGLDESRLSPIEVEKLREMKQKLGAS